MEGKLITLEGIDGSGKTSQLNVVIDFLKQKNINFIVTREPGGTQIGEKIRDILLDTENEKMLPETETLLYAASRAQHVKEVIAPALQQGKWVVCDRFLDASIAYQGSGRQLGIEKVLKVNLMATGGIKPDLTLLLDVRPEIAYRRKGNNERDRLEKEGLNFYNRVRQGYLELSRREPYRIQVLEGEKSFEKVKQDVVSVLDRFLRKVGIS